MSGALDVTPYSSPGLAKPSGDMSTNLSVRFGLSAAKVQAMRPPIELPTTDARAYAQPVHQRQKHRDATTITVVPGWISPRQPETG